MEFSIFFFYVSFMYLAWALIPWHIKNTCKIFILLLSLF